jgi:histidine ammonia-lyase
LLAAAQGVELRRPVQTSPKLRRVMEILRKDTKFWDQDRMMAPEIEAAKRVARYARLRDIVPLSAF